MSITLDGTSGITTPDVDSGPVSGTNFSYTGTLTGGTGVVNLGSGQVYKDASGNVGIGTSSPGTRLHIADSSGGGSGRIRMSCTVSAGYDSRIFQDDTGLNFSAVSDSRSLVFRTGNSDVERMRIDGNGSQSSVIPGGSTLYPEFKCRAWVNFNGTGTVAIRASGNVSSITDNGTGIYAVNFTTAMPDANYSIVLSSEIGGGAGGFNGTTTSPAPSTSAFTFIAYTQSGALRDISNAYAAIFR